MATDFTNLIQSLHGGAKLQDNYESDDTVIVIDAKRQFTPGSEFDTIIAFEGDINSQIITFRCVRYTDKHDLSACQNKELKWKNRANGIEGVSKLLLIDDKTTETDFYMQWELPSEACTQAGQLEISIQLYDKQNNYIAFSWNTSTYTGLSIAASMPSVTTDLEFNFPPRDEILLIDRETRNILAPSGYNNIICNYGDVGIARVSFLIERYVGRNKNLDVFDTNTIIYLFVKQNNTLLVEEKELEKRLYSEEFSDRIDKKEGLVFFDWVPDADFTCSGVSPYNIGKFDISIKITTKDKQKIWNSNSYGKLELGPSPTMITTQEGDEDIEVPVVSLTDITDAHYLDSDFKIQEKYYDAADINNISDTHYLDGGKIKASYLPSYVDDVLEYPSVDEFPENGEDGKIYVDLDTGITYRWGGSTYVEVGVGTYTTSTPTTAAIGGIGKGISFDKKKITEVLDMLLHPYVKFSNCGVSRNSNIQVQKFDGTVKITSITVKATLGSNNFEQVALIENNTTIATITPDSGKDLNYSFSLSKDITKNNNPTFKVKIGDGTNTETLTVSGISFVYPYYYGVISSTTPINANIFNSLTEDVKVKGKKEYTYNTKTTECAVIAYPVEYKELKSIIDQNNFTQIWDKNTVSYNGTQYYVYVSGAAAGDNITYTFNHQ